MKEDILWVILTEAINLAEGRPADLMMKVQKDLAEEPLPDLKEEILKGHLKGKCTLRSVRNAVNAAKFRLGQKGVSQFTAAIALGKMMITNQESVLHRETSSIR